MAAARKFLFCNNSVAGAVGHAGTAADTLFGVDNAFAVNLFDAVYGAVILAYAAADTVIRFDFESHVSHLHM